MAAAVVNSNCELGSRCQNRLFMLFYTSLKVRFTPELLSEGKRFPNVGKIFRAMREYISDEILISAYDIHYKELETDFDFASCIFVDSGGYEASKDTELSETFDRAHIPKKWTVETYHKVIAGWQSASPAVFVSFDHPKSRVSIAEQVSRAKSSILPVGPYVKELLIKPETEDSKRLHLDRVLPCLKTMDDFAVVGITEKEVGNCTLERMVNIAKIRQELDLVRPETPIHVFGSLDTISTYLYFLAGGDIFDGLTWLRYAFIDGDTVYRHSFGTLTLPITTHSDIVEGRCWANNYQYMQEMRLSMLKYLKDGKFDHFGKHKKVIENSFLSMNAELFGG